MKPRRVLMLTLGLLAGCGVKQPPIPPSELLTPPPTAVQARVREGCAGLSWRAPARGAAGYRVLRRQADDPAPEPLAGLPAENPSYTDCDIPAGESAVYQVQSLNDRGKAGPPSSELKIFFAAAPPAPASLTAEPGDGFAQLCWTNPSAVALQAGFRIYRAMESGPYPNRSINPDPESGPCWVDGNLLNGKTYRYQVRAVLKTEAGIEIEGPPSPEALVAPKDKIPPLPPADLVAAASAQGVVLHWNRNLERDLRGYYVYRRPPAESRGQRITEQPLPLPEYLDADPTLVAGREYVYTVTALDNAPEPNESKPSAPASVLTLPR